MNPTRTHVFLPDTELPADLPGHRYGRCCPLPEANQIHKPPDRPPNDRSRQILGERDD